MTVTVETMKTWTSRLLLAFVLVTIGFAAGRRTAPQAASSDPHTMPTDAATSEQVVVYAAHMTFRCPECNQIEWLARELVESEFAAELESGTLDFQTKDYMKDTEFAKRYNIFSSTIVVVRFENGEEQDFKRLDEVWSKVKNRDDFFAYVRTAIQKAFEAKESEA